MLIKAENSSKSDLCSFKDKMSRRAVFKKWQQNSLIMWIPTAVLTSNGLNWDSKGERDSPAIHEICASPKRLRLEGECSI